MASLIQDYTNGLAAARAGRGLFQGPVQPGTNESFFRATGRQIPAATMPAYSNAGGGGNPAPQPQQISAPTGPSPEDLRIQELRNSISSGWDNYLSSLNGLNTGLQDQRTAQENILSSQLQSGKTELEGQKARSLRDVATNISGAFQAGNNFLGLRGAGDSSAANQYQFALTKEAAKQSNAVNEFTNSELNKLQASYDQGIQGVASWFANAQNELKQLIASGQLNKEQDIQALSRDILNNALAQKAQIEQNSQSRYNALLEWATNNSQNIGQLTQNIAAIPRAFGSPTIDSRGNLFQAPVGTGGFGDTNENKNQFNFNNSWFQ